MGRYIVCLVDQEENKEYFLHWSSIVDAPVTFGLGEKEFREYWKEEYGRQGMKDLDDDIRSAREIGTSLKYDGTSAEEAIEGNRAGREGTELTMDQIIYAYCRNRIDNADQMPVGKENEDDEGDDDE